MSKLMKEIENNLVNEPLFSEYFSSFEEFQSNTHIEQHGNEDIEVLEIRGNTSKEDRTSFKILRLYKNSNNQIVILNIYLPGTMRNKGFGMKILSIVHELCKSQSHSLFIDDMVSSFHRKMLKRGAAEINYEAVEITDDTQLFVDNGLKENCENL